MNYSNTPLRPIRLSSSPKVETVFSLETDKRGTHLRVRKPSTIARKLRRSVAVAAAVTFFAAFSAIATVVNFTEDFASSTANWSIGTSSGTLVAPTYNLTGGPDNSAYISNPTDFTAVGTGNRTLFRGQDNFNSSSKAFVGNWISDGIKEFSFSIRHNYTSDLTFFTRFATAANSPAVAASIPTIVAPNVWTKLTIQIYDTNPNFTPEGGPGTYTSTFSSLGNLQIGFAVPAALANTPTTVTFGLDKPAVSTVPEPTTAALLSLGAVGLLLRRRTVVRA